MFVHPWIKIEFKNRKRVVLRLQYKATFWESQKKFFSHKAQEHQSFTIARIIFRKINKTDSQPRPQGFCRPIHFLREKSWGRGWQIEKFKSRKNSRNPGCMIHRHPEGRPCVRGTWTNRLPGWFNSFYDTRYSLRFRLLFWKYTRPHVAYSIRFCPSTRKR